MKEVEEMSGISGKGDEESYDSDEFDEESKK